MRLLCSDPNTGSKWAAEFSRRSPFQRGVKNLHRTLLIKTFRYAFDLPLARQPVTAEFASNWFVSVQGANLRSFALFCNFRSSSSSSYDRVPLAQRLKYSKCALVALFLEATTRWQPRKRGRRNVIALPRVHVYKPLRCHSIFHAAELISCSDKLGV